LTILLKNPPFILRELRANRGAVEINRDFPFVLTLVEAFIGFFTRVLWESEPDFLRLPNYSASLRKFSPGALFWNSQNHYFTTKDTKNTKFKNIYFRTLRVLL